VFLSPAVEGTQGVLLMSRFALLPTFGKGKDTPVIVDLDRVETAFARAKGGSSLFFAAGGSLDVDITFEDLQVLLNIAPHDRRI
jgi:hypothetical protein